MVIVVNFAGLISSDHCFAFVVPAGPRDGDMDAHEDHTGGRYG